MKNLKMFAIAVMAFAVMAMGVHATGSYTQASTTCDDTDSCVASIGTHKYVDFEKALDDAQSGDTITLLKGDTVSTFTVGKDSANALGKSITIDLDEYTLNLGTNQLFVGENGALTITGKEDAKLTSSAASSSIVVEKGGSLTVKGALTLRHTAAGSLIKVDEGKVTVSEGATLAGNASGKVVEITNKDAEVSLNAKVGSKTSPYTGTLVDTSAVTNKTVKVTFEGGEYYVNTVATIAAASKGVTLVVNNGTFKSTVDSIVVHGGNLEINGGSITSAGNETLELDGGNTTINGGTLKSDKYSVIYTLGSTKGTLTVKGGLFISGEDATNSPVWLANKAFTYSFTAGTFDGPENTPAIYILDELLTGMEEDGDADHFKGILTGGKYLYSIIGGAKIGKNSYSSADVTNYVVAEGKDVTTEGDYKVIGAGTSAGEPGTTEPGDSTIPPVPQTNDNILVYAGLGLVSLASVAFTTRKRED